jgi:nitroreductase
MHSSLNAIFQRRAIRLFDPIEIPPALRDELLEAARLAPSSFNIQPYRLFWVSSGESLRTVAQLCFSQPPRKPHALSSSPSLTSARGALRLALSSNGCVRLVVRPRRLPSSNANPN